MSDVICLNVCILSDHKNLFAVEVPRSHSVLQLQKLIKQETATDLNLIATYRLEIWKLPVPLQVNEIPVQLDNVVDMRDFKGAENLEGLNEVSMYFNKPLDQKRLHIVVQIRSQECRISPSTSQPSDLSEPDVQGVCYRTNTVQTLYKKLNRYKFIQVRGPPASGKTTLLKILYKYIKQNNRRANIQIISGWELLKAGENNADIHLRLQQRVMGYPNPSVMTYILLDNGQDTYWDEYLWEEFFKNATSLSNRTYRVIIFCTYGSAGIRPLDYKIGIPLDLDPRARVSLVPNSEQEDEFGPVGLLYTREEFNEVIKLMYEQELGTDLQDLIFSWTNGHPGAVEGVLRIISTGAQYANRRGTLLDLKSFFEATTFGAFFEELARPGGWTRGLPKSDDLKRPEVVGVFRDLVQNRSIPHASPSPEPDPVNECHKNGWVFATTDQDGQRVYVLPSPLHRLYFEWKLLPSSTPLLFYTLWDLSIKVIEGFRPSQLSNLSRRVSDAGVARPTEAAYQDEFYRSLFSVTHGCVRVLQGARQGCIDFFIPSTKWGIELLHDGSKLEEHGTRLFSHDARGAWIASSEMMDNIILDFRSAPPKKAHPHIQKLYHVVFRNNSPNHITILNNKLEVVKESALTEN